ncbi:hypothetical protein ACFQZQ_07270 [Lysobacter koreensis]|uniref:Uncharacterized protein n=1 Tax=Lysobacter koreensis TaxID=266122 RepID=A0ABW2YPI0_9GAMM
MATALVAALSTVSAAAAESGAVVPVLWESPGCRHEKLGPLVVQTGERVSEITQDERVPTVRYQRAVVRLADAAAAKGANAVVLRQHQAVYFTRLGRKSQDPVFIKLDGAAIRLPADASHCMLVAADVAELERRARTGKPVNVSSRHAYGE